jgi:hypothetical protein
MASPVRTGPSLVVAVLLMGCSSVRGAQIVPAQAAGPDVAHRLTLVVVAGDGAINNVKLRSARDIIIQVQDENHRPVAGASVAFAVEAKGAAAGSFAHSGFLKSGKLLTLLSDHNGRAIAAIKPNHAIGVFKINVTASLHGQTATAAITQTNTLASATAATSAAGSAGGSGGAGGGTGAGGGGAAGSGTAGTAGATTAGAAAGTAGTAAGTVAGTAAGTAGAAGAGAAAGISGAAVAGIAGGAAAAAVVGATVATSGKEEQTKSTPTATIGDPGNPSLGPRFALPALLTRGSGFSRLSGSSAPHARISLLQAPVRPRLDTRTVPVFVGPLRVAGGSPVSTIRLPRLINRLAVLGVSRIRVASLSIHGRALSFSPASSTPMRAAGRTKALDLPHGDPARHLVAPLRRRQPGMN